MVDAVLVMRPTAVVAPDIYELYVVPHQRLQQERDLVLRGERFSGAHLAWNGPRLLELYYSEAFVGKFKNYWESPDVDKLKYVVEIRLVPRANGLAIPPGGR
jgi:hypothetical protein